MLKCEVWQCETSLPHMCPKCGEELCYIGARRPDGLGMTVVMCFVCSDVLPVLPLMAETSS